MDTAATRNAALDGLRGWAALSVTGYHFYWETFGVRFPEIRNPFAALVINGHLAVAIFFVISGYVLTVNRWFRPPRPGAWTLFVKRYTRLTIPVLGGSAIVLALVMLEATPNGEAAAIVGAAGLGNWVGPSTNWQTLLHFSTIDMYLDDFSGGYGPFLWTMTIELWGSFMVLAICVWQRALRLPGALLAALAALFLVVNPPWSGFFFGALVAYAQRDGKLQMVLAGRAGMVLASVVVAGVLTIGGLASWAGHVTEGEDLAQYFICTLLAPVLLAVVLVSPQLTRLLCAPLSDVLGRLSFPLYIVHFPVLVSLTSWLIVVADRAGALTLWTALAIASVSLGASLVAAALFLPVERLTGWVGRAIDRLAVGGQPAGTVVHARPGKL